MGVKQENVDDEPIINNFQDPTKLNQHEGSATIKRDIKIVPVDKFQLVPEFLKVRGLVKQHLESYNYFVNIGIKKILRANDRIVSKIDPTIYLRFKDIRIGKPTVEYDSVRDDNTPYKSRQSDLTYAAPIYVNIEYITGSHVKKTRVEKNDVVIGEMPVMLRSCRCVLYQKNEAELSRLGECPLDPGGYFIIKGTEKVLMIQEQLSDNRIIIDKDKKGRVIATVTSITEKWKSQTVICMDKQKIYLQNTNRFTTMIPIMVVLKAMGMESDQEVVQMIGRDPRYSALLLPSIEECANQDIYTRQQALAYLRRKEAKSSFYGASEKEDRIMTFLRDTFLANVPVNEQNLRPKCLYTAVMMRRMLDAIVDKSSMDDKDYVGNKRLKLSGELVSLLFEDLFKTMIDNVQKKIDKLLQKPSRSSPFDFAQHLERDIITGGLERTLSTGNFSLKRFKMDKKGMTQVLLRLSFIGTLGHMTKIQPQFEKSMKVSGPRALQPSQWGMLCPCDTPEGEACGLVKNLALMTHVTTDEEEGPLKSMCYCLGVEDLELLSGEELHTPNSFLIIFNGLIIGKHRRPQKFANAMRKLRRAGKIGNFVSVFVNEKQRCVYIASDGGRVCRPLVIAENGRSKIKECHMRELLDGVRTFDDFLLDGLIEYLDVNEENNCLIALYEGESSEKTTHIEIEPFTILGIIAGLIPYPHHNQSPRNTYQCAMGKQAMGNIAYNQLCRMDTLLYLLVYPQRPLLTTRTIELVGYDKLGAGQNATVAVMSYSGYDIEDAIVMNKSSLDRGFGRCIVMKKLSAINQKYKDNTSDRIVRPEKRSHRLQILDHDGLASPGEIIRNNDVYINKSSPIPSSGEYKLCPGVYKGGTEGETCVVDRVSLYSDKNENECFKFIIRNTRRPEVGDKFSSRHGQKGVCGTIVRQEDFPFSERGICPDLIMNPHGFPSRMTVGKMIELLGGKAGVSSGRFHYGSAFGEPSGHADRVEAISETLVKHGFSYSGKDFIYSGITGCPLQTYIFMGPIYYQKLKHMVLDKMHARVSSSLRRKHFPPAQKLSIQEWSSSLVFYVTMDQLMKSYMAIMNERDAAIRERNMAIVEKKKATTDRDMAILQRDAAVSERNNAVLERDDVFAQLQYHSNSMNRHNLTHSLPGNGMPHGPKHVQHQHMHLLPQLAEAAYSPREVPFSDTFPSSPVASETAKPKKVKRTKETKTVPPKKSPKLPRKSKRGSKVSTKQVKIATTDGWKVKKELGGEAEWKDNLSLNQVNFDETTMPVPACSCTGTLQSCYKWGNGGWQSACCTNTLSMYPLPHMDNKRHSRLGGRKMSGNVFNKLLSRLAAEGHDLSTPLDLKEHWARHGTNRYITIK